MNKRFFNVTLFVVGVSLIASIKWYKLMKKYMDWQKHAFKNVIIVKGGFIYETDHINISRV